MFRSNRPEPQGGDGVTQFGRALNDLNVDIICANSAPAKGRVERANSTLRDRLVKELRLQGVSSIEAANAFAPAFVADYNARFAKAPHKPFNAHRALLPTEVLDESFTWQETRKLSHSLTFNYQRQLFVIPDTEETRLLAGQRLTVVELSDFACRRWQFPPPRAWRQARIVENNDLHLRRGVDFSNDTCRNGSGNRGRSTSHLETQSVAARRICDESPLQWAVVGREI